MKKILLIVSLVCATMVANAQWYVGGALGFGVETQKTDDGDKIGTLTNFSLMPEVGYSLNEKFDLGISGGFGMDSYKPEGGEKVKGNNWEVAPYARYSVVEFGKFKVMGKAKLYVAGGEKFLKNEIAEGIYTYAEGVESTSFGLNVIPVLGYSVSDNFILLANLNFFGLGIDYNKVKDSTSTFKFGLNANTNTVANTNDFEIGFAYIF